MRQLPAFTCFGKNETIFPVSLFFEGFKKKSYHGWGGGHPGLGFEFDWIMGYLV